MAITLNGNSNVSLLYSSGGRITGDFTNATLLSRAMFQTSTADSSTGIYALPSGTSTAASWQATNNADPTNASKVLIATNGTTDVQLVSGRNGSGTYLPLSFYTNGSPQMQLDTSGNLALGSGLSPSAWGSAWKVLEGQGGFLGSNATSGIVISNNSYSNGTNWIYKNTAAASQYFQLSGQHQWYTAPSGTANTAISGANAFVQVMTLDASGNLLVGATSTINTNKCVIQTASDGQLLLNASNSSSAYSTLSFANQNVVKSQIYWSAASGYLYVNNGSGGVYMAANAAAWTTNSDERLKDIIEPITDAVSKVGSLRAVIGKYKTDDEGTRKAFLIAQDVELVLPEAVTKSKLPRSEDETEYLGVSYTDTIPLLVAAIKELTTRLEALESK